MQVAVGDVERPERPTHLSSVPTGLLAGEVDGIDEATAVELPRLDERARAEGGKSGHLLMREARVGRECPGGVEDRVVGDAAAGDREVRLVDVEVGDPRPDQVDPVHRVGLARTGAELMVDEDPHGLRIELGCANAVELPHRPIAIVERPGDGQQRLHPPSIQAREHRFGRWLRPEVERQRDDLRRHGAAEVVVRHEHQRLPPVGQDRPERHPLDVAERDTERAQVEQQLLPDRPNLLRRQVVHVAHVRRPGRLDEIELGRVADALRERPFQRQQRAAVVERQQLREPRLGDIAGRNRRRRHRIDRVGVFRDRQPGREIVADDARRRAGLGRRDRAVLHQRGLGGGVERRPIGRDRQALEAVVFEDPVRPLRERWRRLELHVDRQAALQHALGADPVDRRSSRRSRAPRKRTSRRTAPARCPRHRAGSARASRQRPA